MRIRSVFIAVMFCLGCKSRQAAAPVRHLVSARQPGAELYLDRLDNRAILQKVDTSGTTVFCSFLVGWRDSLLACDAGKRAAREKYIQYSMQQDWTALVGGDSLRPVFFQEKPGHDPQLTEGAMVFEIPKGGNADTLIFRDTYSAWGTQIFVLNGK